MKVISATITFVLLLAFGFPANAQLDTGGTGDEPVTIDKEMIGRCLKEYGSNISRLLKSGNLLGMGHYCGSHKQSFGDEKMQEKVWTGVMIGLGAAVSGLRAKHKGKIKKTSDHHHNGETGQERAGKEKLGTQQHGVFQLTEKDMNDQACQFPDGKPGANSSKDKNEKSEDVEFSACCAIALMNKDIGNKDGAAMAKDSNSGIFRRWDAAQFSGQGHNGFKMAGEIKKICQKDDVTADEQKRLAQSLFKPPAR